MTPLTTMVPQPSEDTEHSEAPDVAHKVKLGYVTAKFII